MTHIDGVILWTKSKTKQPFGKKTRLNNIT